MRQIKLATVTALALIGSVGLVFPADSSTMSDKASGTTATQSMSNENLSLTTSEQKQAWNGIESQAKKQNAPPSFTASVGATVPSGIALSTVPEKVVNMVPKLRTYDYALISNQLLIVNPKSKTIVDVISGSA